jgi:PKD repeat protein
MSPSQGDPAPIRSRALMSPVHARPHLALFAALLVALIAAVAGTGAATAGAKPSSGKTAGRPGKSRGPIASPRPGEQVKHNNLRLVVTAGPEREDLRAKLNGVAIGERFRVNLKRHRRYLEASLVDGLRRGPNTLVVWVKRKGGGYRRASVDFVVAHRAPMTSAGPDLRVAAGATTELHGQIQTPPSVQGGTEVEWKVVSAPQRSELSTPLGTIGPAAGGPEPAGLEEADTLSPVFAPDVPGRYTVEMTASGASGTSTDAATIYVVPSTPLVNLDTEVKAGENGAQPGVRIGSNYLAAPFLRTAAGAKNYSGTIEGIQYKAIWQIVALERSTTALKWNRTYGICQTAQSGGWYPCRVGETGAGAQVGVPVAAKLGEELGALGNETLVIAASHPSGGAGMEWAAPDESKFVEADLGPIGFPKESDPEIGAQITAAKAGEMAGVGVPGLTQGEATIIAGAGTKGLVGYLSPDSSVPTPHYGFISPQRIPFDTRAASGCNSQGCSVTQRIGKGPGAVEVKGTVPANEGGFLVAGYNRLTLAPIESKTFVTALSYEEQELNFGPARAALERMSAYVAGLAKKQAIVLITSIHGAKQARKVLYEPGTPPWEKLLNEVAAIGGTHEELITGATTAGADYSLVGAAKLAEGAGAESSTAGARLRGFFVPDGDSIYRPEAVNPTTAPNELLMNTVLSNPGTEPWPDENNPEVMAAMSWIGTHTKLLGSRPRFSYWNKLATAAFAGEALEEVKTVSFERGQGFKARAFTSAKEDLTTELPLVKSVRAYMEELASPAGGGTEAWEKAFSINAELKDLLEKLKEKGKATAQYLSFLSQVLQVAATFAGFPEASATVKFIEAAVVAGESGQSVYNTNYDGSEGKPGIEVEAAKLGEELVEQAKANEKSFARFGDIVVSDWSKLKLIGKFGGCNPEGSCGPKGEYTELAYDPPMAEAARQVTTDGFERELYTRLVPIAFPIWKTEPETNSQATNLGEHYFCRDDSYPFYRAPELAYFKSLSGFFPAESEHPYTTTPFTWQVYLSVARSGTTYGWASKSMLEHMFNPLNAKNAKEDGLQMNRGDFMREGERIGKYIPARSCYWY